MKYGAGAIFQATESSSGSEALFASTEHCQRAKRHQLAWKLHFVIKSKSELAAELAYHARKYRATDVKFAFSINYHFSCVWH